MRRTGRFRAACLMLLALALMVSVGAAASDGVRAKSLTVAPMRMTLYVGSDGPVETRQLLTTVKPDTATAPLQYRSSSNAVARVDASGLVTPVKPGTARLSVCTTDGSKLKRVASVTVKPVKPTAVTLSPQALTLAPNAKAALTPVVAPANAYNKGVTWSSSNPAVAKVSQTGVVTAVKLGTATIRAKTKAGGFVGTAAVTVAYGEANIYYVAIGQEDYATSGKLDGCLNDARRVEATLNNSDFGHRATAGNVYADLTGPQIRQVLSSMPSTYGMTDQDITYFYYSGHGAGDVGKVFFTRAERGALVGVEYTYANRATSLVTVDEIRTYLDRVPGTVVVIIDSCFSGQYVTPKGLSAAAAASASNAAAVRDRAVALDIVNVFRASPANDAVKGLHSLVDNNPLKSKYKIIVACKPIQESQISPYGKNSIFTRFICEAGGIGGASESSNRIEDLGYLPGDKNNNGYVSVQEVYAYANPRALKLSKAYYYYTPQNMVVWPANDSFPVFARVS